MISDIRKFLMSGNRCIFCYQKIIFDARKYFLISENATIFRYQKLFFDIRNYFLISDNPFLISEIHTFTHVTPVLPCMLPGINNITFAPMNLYKDTTYLILVRSSATSARLILIKV